MKPSRVKPRRSVATPAPGFTLNAKWAAAALALLTVLFFHQVALEGQTFVAPDATAPVGFHPPVARFRIVRDGATRAEHAGPLDPYTVEILVEEALRAGAGARLEIEVRGDDETTAAARGRFADLAARGVDVRARAVAPQTPPAA